MKMLLQVCGKPAVDSPVRHADEGIDSQQDQKSLLGKESPKCRREIHVRCDEGAVGGLFGGWRLFQAEGENQSVAHSESTKQSEAESPSCRFGDVATDSAKSRACIHSAHV